jgi:molybdate transport repressor ModE-like protein
VKLHQLRALAEIARAGSIQRAARSMNLSQPALSKSILELERQLGVVLLLRGAGGATLTPFGAILAKRYPGIQKELDKAREEVEWLRGMSGGHLLVGLSPPVAGTGIAPLFTQFRERQPGVELEVLELRPALIFDAVRSGILDFGIVHHYGGMEAVGMQCTRLVSYPTILAIGRSESELPRTVDAVWSRDWITGDQADFSDGYVSILSSRLGLEAPKRIFRCTSITLYFDLCEQTGIISHWADIPNPHLAAKFSSGALTRLETGIELPNMEIALACKDEELLSPGGALLAKIIRSYFQQDITL